MSTITVDQRDLLEEVDLAILAYYLEVDSRGEFLHSPGQSVRHFPEDDPERLRQEDEQLDEFIRLAYGCALPKKVITPGHKAPFQFVSDLFYERVKNALAFANRNGGKTWDVAILNHLDMVLKGECEVASAGATLDQANKCYRYFQEFSAKQWFRNFCDHFQEQTGRQFVKKNIQSKTEFGNGSIQEIITGSEKGLRGPHPHKARIDEVDEIEWEILQTGLSMARSSEGIRGQNTFTSTRQKAKGSMQRLLDESGTKGIEVYEWNIWESLEKCPRRCMDDPVHGNCPVYTYCKGKAHHCAGFYKIDDFIDKVRILDRDTFETEWENKKPSKHKLVYHQFDHSRHVMTPKRLLSMFGIPEPSRFWYCISSLDFGSSPGHPFVYLKFLQLPSGAWLQFYEYFAEQRLLMDHAKAIKSSPRYMSGDPIYSDWDAQDRLELKNYGVRTKPAVKDVVSGLDFVGSMLNGFPPAEEPMLYVWHTCHQTISEYGSYSWPKDGSGRIDRSGVPKKEHDHAMDATRYAFMTHRRNAGSKYSGSKRKW